MFTSVLTCKKLLINKNYPPGKFLITHPFKILEKKKLKILRYIFAHLWKIFYWWYFIVPIFCRLITKIVTLKKEVNELRKQQLLQSSDGRYGVQFHWLPFFYAPKPMKGSIELYLVKNLLINIWQCWLQCWHFQHWICHCYM